MIQNVLLVCIGNICRSPMAEVLLASKLSKDFPDVLVHSAGIGALVDQPADPTAQSLMTMRGLDLSSHRARQLSENMAFKSDLILTMTTDQQHCVEAQFSGTIGRVYRLGKWGSFDVPDPYKRPKMIFEQALCLIDQGIHEWFNKVWG